MGRLRASERYGANPSIDVCYYCKQAKGVVLQGRLPGDREAPREAVSSLEPCEDCKRRFNDLDAIVFVGAYKSSEGIGVTGDIAVVKRSAVKRLQDEGILTTDVVTPAMHTHRVCYMESKVMHYLGLLEEGAATYPDFNAIDRELEENNND